MKLTFLGTGAADWDINAFTPDAPHRRFQSALIDDSLLIDPGPHIFHFTQHNGTPNLLDNVKNIIVTHSHRDHFDAQSVARLCAGKDCTVWADPMCRQKLINILGEDVVATIKFNPISLRQTYTIGDYTITTLRANHATEFPEEAARMYLIGKDDRLLWWTGDSAWVPTESWNIIKTQPVNTVAIELTCGETSPDDWRIFEHNTPDMLKLMLTMFKKYNHFAPDVKYYTMHMARTLHTDHQRLEEFLAPLGVTPSYDGMVIDI